MPEYLKHLFSVRNRDKWQELMGYLEKHQPEIINYKRRTQAGKTIGSGRVEKGVDLTVGRRQKNKGMSWSHLGSRALPFFCHSRQKKKRKSQTKEIKRDDCARYS
jgi:hypothetical protein